MPSIIRMPSAWIKYNGSLITDADIPAEPTWSTGQVSFRSESTRPSMALRFLMEDVGHVYPFYPTFTDGWYSQTSSSQIGHLTEEQLNTLNTGSGSVIITTSQLVLNMSLTYEPTKLYVTLSNVAGSQGGDISVYWSGKPVGSSISWYLGSRTIPSRTYGTFGINANPRPLT